MAGMVVSSVPLMEAHPSIAQCKRLMSSRKDPALPVAQQVSFDPLCPHGPGGFGTARVCGAAQQLRFALEATRGNGGPHGLVLQGIRMLHGPENPLGPFL